MNARVDADKIAAGRKRRLASFGIYFESAVEPEFREALRLGDYNGRSTAPPLDALAGQSPLEGFARARQVENAVARSEQSEAIINELIERYVINDLPVDRIREFESVGRFERIEEIVDEIGHGGLAPARSVNPPFANDEIRFADFRPALADQIQGECQVGLDRIFITCTRSLKLHIQRLPR